MTNKLKNSQGKLTVTYQIWTDLSWSKTLYYYHETLSLTIKLRFTQNVKRLPK